SCLFPAAPWIADNLSHPRDKSRLFRSRTNIRTVPNPAASYILRSTPHSATVFHSIFPSADRTVPTYAVPTLTKTVLLHRNDSRAGLFPMSVFEYPVV